MNIEGVREVDAMEKRELIRGMEWQKERTEKWEWREKEKGGGYMKGGDAERYREWDSGIKRGGGKGGVLRWRGVLHFCDTGKNNSLFA